jgi:hypothetical protein
MTFRNRSASIETFFEWLAAFEEELIWFRRSEASVKAIVTDKADDLRRRFKAGESVIDAAADWDANK